MVYIPSFTYKLAYENIIFRIKLKYLHQVDHPHYMLQIQKCLLLLPHCLFDQQIVTVPLIPIYFVVDQQWTELIVAENLLKF